MSLRIGVVDTGVDREHRWFEESPIEGIGIGREGGNYRYEADYGDLVGHGTAVASLIAAFCPRAQINAVRIAQQDGNSAIPYVQERALAMGIRWCINQGIRIVNVSYSISETSRDGPLVQTCRSASEAGVILVAAYRNGEKRPVFPAAFPTVIEATYRPDLRPGGISILSEKNHDLSAWGGTCEVACPGNSSTTMSGTSLAAAQVSAMVGRIHTVDSSLELDDVFAFLTEVAVE